MNRSGPRSCPVMSFAMGDVKATVWTTREFSRKKKQIVYKIQFSYKASFLVVFLEMFIIL